MANWTFFKIEGTGNYASKIEDFLNQAKADVHNMQSFMSGHHFRIWAIDNSQNPSAPKTNWELKHIEGRGDAWQAEMDILLGKGKTHIIGSNQVGTVFYVQQR